MIKMGLVRILLLLKKNRKEKSSLIEQRQWENGKYLDLKEKGLLPLEELKKALDEKGIKYDRNQIGREYFPLKDVEACLNEGRKTIFNKKVNASPNHRPCPLCGKPSEELKWIWFESPEWTWKKLCGRAGDMSICPDCRCIVEFICEILS